MPRVRTLASILLLATVADAHTEFGRASEPALAPPAAETSVAGWPQWGGPSRDFRVDSTLAPSWETRPPRRLWDRPLGNGHSGFVVDERAAYTMYGGERIEAVVALDRDTGRTVWETRYPVGYQSHLAEYDGPHATPVAVGERLYTVGIDATVLALERRSGEVVWRRRLVAEEGVELPQSGYAASPLAWRGLLLLPGLGGGGPGALALDLEDGRTVWARHDFRSSHAAPLLVRTGGREHAVFHGLDWLYGLEPATGELLWRHRVRRGAADNVSFTPIWDAARGQLLVSHGFDSRGARALELRPEGDGFTVEEVWHNGRLQVRHTNGVLLGSLLLGSHGGLGVLTALDAGSGELRWRRRLGKATLVAAGELLLILDEQGELHLARATAAGIDLVASLPVLDYNAWTAPSLVGRRLYLRDRMRAVALELP